MSIEVRVPVTGESVTEATVGLWLCQEGDAVAAGEPLVELETDKVNLEVAAERSGVLVKIARQVGEVVKPGEVLAYLEQAPAAETASQAADPSAPTATPTSRPHASPLASRIAQAHGVDLANVPGSGTAGRVTREDVERYLEASAPDAAAAPGQAAEASTAAPEPLPKPEQAPAGEGAAPEPHRRETRERMSRRRRTIAERLLEAQRTAAMLTTFAEADLAAVQELRARHREAFQQRHGVRLGLMSFFVRATVAALRAYPRLNAEMQGDEIVLKQYYDLGIAVAAPEGLVVPVLRDADRQSFAELEHEIVRLAQRVQDHSLTLDDLRGGTFTITNGGVFGSLLSTPILSPPQVGILGLHTIQERPVARGGQVVIRPMMYLALTYDHRIVDGAEAVQFLGRVRQLIEEPAALLLDL